MSDVCGVEDSAEFLVCGWLFFGVESSLRGHFILNFHAFPVVFEPALGGLEEVADVAAAFAVVFKEADHVLCPVLCLALA